MQSGLINEAVVALAAGAPLLTVVLMAAAKTFILMVVAALKSFVGGRQR
jgi:hypothetical protein